jgi:hypothetical protein
MGDDYEAPTPEQLLAWGRAVEEVMSGRVNCSTVNGAGGRTVMLVRSVQMIDVGQLRQVAGLDRPRLRIVD